MTQVFSLAIAVLVFFAIISRFNGAVRLYGPLFITAILFGEFSFAEGQIEEKSSLILVLLFILLGHLKFVGSDLFVASRKYIPNWMLLLTVVFCLLLVAQALRSLVEFPRGIGPYFWSVFFVVNAAAAALLLSSRSARKESEADLERTIREGRALCALLLAYSLVICASYTLETSGLVSFRPNLPNRSTLLFGLTCFFPVLFFHASYDSDVWRKVALTAIAVGFLSALLISSRAAAVPLLVIFVLALIRKRGRGLAINIVGLSIVSTVFALFTSPDFVADGLQTIIDSFSTFTGAVSENTGQYRDLDRLLHYVAAYQLASESTSTLLFGTGFRSSGFYLAPILADLYALELAHLDFEYELGQYGNVYTFGWSGVLADLGLSGLFLSFLLAVCPVIVGFKHLDKMDLMVLGFTIAVFILRMFANNFTGSHLYYFVLFPMYWTAFILSLSQSLRLRKISRKTKGPV